MDNTKRPSESDSETSSVYPMIAKHQRDESWYGQEILSELQIWTERFTVEFKLDILEVVLRIDPLPVTRYGHFRYGHNGFGLRGEIAINARYVVGRPWWEILGTLLHELCHAWQQAYGSPGKRNHHNAEFRQKARDLGLIVDRRGVTGYALESPFKELLRRFGVEVPAGEVTPTFSRTVSKSKLVKWTCSCPTNVRVAIADFRALCLKCNTEFVRRGIGTEAGVISYGVEAEPHK